LDRVASLRRGWFKTYNFRARHFAVIWRHNRASPPHFVTPVIVPQGVV
jgi:hypothetical protein